MRDWKEKNVVIVGAARQGKALARYFVNKKAKVILNDQKTELELKDARRELNHLSGVGYPVRWVYGGHPMNLLDSCDALFISGGVPISIPLITEAFRQGVPVLNDSQLFLETAVCKIIGITGSAGKTTTTTLVGNILDRAVKTEGTELFGNKIWVGGNIGTPLIEFVDEMGKGDVAVLELSSFQLEIMSVSPQVAVILNISPDHLDRHQSMSEYINAKTNIIRFQSPSDISIFNRDDEHTMSISGSTRNRVITFGLAEPELKFEGTFLRDKEVIYRGNVHNNYSKSRRIRLVGEDNFEETLLKVKDIQIKGIHNLSNVLAAAAITYSAGVTAEIIQAAVKDFKGVVHRLEFVRKFKGAIWVNDSIATTPSRSIAAIQAFDEPIILLAGGRDKNLDWKEFTELIKKRVKHLILFGETGEKLYSQLHHLDEDYLITKCDTLKDAVFQASDIVQEGDVVLLSPGATSFDEFENYEERGKWFKKWVEELS
ncbi:MAG: UDP-N-acetylmuramoyl-L-alanine--D-glutamate ligase [Anaerolineales bacterium]